MYTQSLQITYLHLRYKDKTALTLFREMTFVYCEDQRKGTVAFCRQNSEFMLYIYTIMIKIVDLNQTGSISAFCVKALSTHSSHSARLTSQMGCI
jgi:hypothetical protein